MSVVQWCLRGLLLINLLFWGMYVIGWDWFGFQNHPADMRFSSDILEFLRHNVFQILLVFTWIAGLVGLKDLQWPQAWNFMVSAGMYSVFAIVSWREYQHDSIAGASRGAFETLVISGVFTAVNILAMGWVVSRIWRSRV